MASAICERLIVGEFPFGGMGFLLNQREAAEFDFWEVEFYPYPNVVEAESADEEESTVLPPFELDLRGLLEIFDDVESFVWRANSVLMGPIRGDHVLIEAKYHGHEVLVGIYSDCPDDEEPVWLIGRDGTFRQLDAE
jgi:hypothetical protein